MGAGSDPLESRQGRNAPDLPARGILGLDIRQASPSAQRVFAGTSQFVCGEAADPASYPPTHPAFRHGPESAAGSGTLARGPGTLGCAGFTGRTDCPSDATLARIASAGFRDRWAGALFGAITSPWKNPY